MAWRLRLIPSGGMNSLMPETTKKERILQVFRNETKDVLEIASRVGARPSYVAQVLQHEGLIESYFDLYTQSARDQNIYSRAFRGVLSFKNPFAAASSVRRIDELYRHYESTRDRAGQHQAMVVALTGMNRARWSGKLEEAAIFARWLIAHSQIQPSVFRRAGEAA